jgi:LysM repeat protein
MASKRNVARKKKQGLFGRFARGRRRKSGKRLGAYVSHENEWQPEVPSFKLSRAFGFVLALHVVAVGGILVYEIFKKDLPGPYRELPDSREGKSEFGAGEQRVSTEGEATTMNYRVAVGDTLGEIAQTVGSSVREISRINDLSGGEIEADMILQVPKPDGTGESLKNQPSTPGRSQNGQAPSSQFPGVSDRPRGAAGTRAGESARLIPASDSTKAQGGGGVLKAQLYRPASPREPTSVSIGEGRSYVEHAVVRGDTLFGLSKRYGVTIELIRTFNGRSGDGIRIGEMIKIPR